MTPRRRDLFERGLRWALPAAALLGAAATVAVVVDPTLLRTGNRDPIADGGPVDRLDVVCEGAVKDGFCRDPEALAEELRTADFTVLEAHVAADGVTRPARWRIAVDRDDLRVVYRVKVRAVPPRLDASNNSPRRELAAFALQRWLFPPDRYVVPPTVLRCLPPAAAESLGETTPFEGSHCVLGVVTSWLENIDELESDGDQPLDGPSAERLADLNVFGFVASHRDAIGSNFFWTSDHSRAFAVDNGMTFGSRRWHPLGWLGATWMRWQDLPVHPATAERLARLSRAELDAALGTVVELHRHGDGYRHVAPSAPWVEDDEDDGVRRRDGDLQLGLTSSEIDVVWERCRELLAELTPSGQLSQR